MSCLLANWYVKGTKLQKKASWGNFTAEMLIAEYSCTGLLCQAKWLSVFRFSSNDQKGNILRLKKVGSLEGNDGPLHPSVRKINLCEMTRNENGSKKTQNNICKHDLLKPFWFWHKHWTEYIVQGCEAEHFLWKVFHHYIFSMDKFQFPKIGLDSIKAVAHFQITIGPFSCFIHMLSPFTPIEEVAVNAVSIVLLPLDMLIEYVVGTWEE